MPVPTVQCPGPCQAVNDTHIQRLALDDDAASPPPEVPLTPTSSMRLGLIGELQQAVKVAHEEGFEQHRLFVTSVVAQSRSEITSELQKMMKAAQAETFEQQRSIFGEGIKDALIQQRSLLSEQITSSFSEQMTCVLQQTTEIAQNLAHISYPARETDPGSSPYQDQPLPAQQQEAPRNLASEQPVAPDTQIGVSMVADSENDTGITAELVKTPTGAHRGATWITDQEGSKPYVAQNFHDLHASDGLASRIVDSRWFHIVAMTMICVNAMYIGIEKDWNPSTTLSNSPWYFQFCEHLFTLFFFRGVDSTFFGIPRLS